MNFMKKFQSVAVHKRRPQSGSGCPSERILRTSGGRGGFRCVSPELFLAKLKDFSKIAVCPQGGGSADIEINFS